MSESPDIARLSPLLAEASAVGDRAGLGRILRMLVVEARASTGCRYAALGVVGEHRLLTEFIYEGLSESEAKAIGHPPVGQGVLGTLIKHNQSLVLDHISAHPESSGFPEHHPDMDNFLGVPVEVGGEVFGNLYLTEKEGGFGPEDLAIVETLSRIAGAAIHTSRLQDRLQRVAVVEDRQRIARDLHDSVIQDLFAVGLSLQTLAIGFKDDESIRLEGIIDTLDNSVNALRRYVLELKEASNVTPGLDEQLQILVARMGRAYPADVRLTLEVTETDNDAESIVLLATEAISNALRHSGGDKVDVILREEDENLVIEVVDNGRGFDPLSVINGMGLANMRARVTALGGNFDVSSSADAGTTVMARIPARPLPD